MTLAHSLRNRAFLRDAADDNLFLRTVTHSLQNAMRSFYGWRPPHTQRVEPSDTPQLESRALPIQRDILHYVTEGSFAKYRAQYLLHPSGQLDPHVALVDIYAVHGKRSDNMTAEQYSYYAFILQRDRPTQLVHIGNGSPIAEHVNSWRKDIDAIREGASCFWLRDNVWAPIEACFDDDVRIVYVCPDRDLSLCPWNALPGKKVGSVLLDDYAIALLPCGAMLCGPEATTPYSADEGNAQWLLVGGVDYNAVQSSSRGTDMSLRNATQSRPQWPELPSTRQELDSISEFSTASKLIRLEGGNATTDRFLEHVTKAKWVHIATHGFYANDDFIDSMSIGGDRITAARRDPLLLNGIVLAGANNSPLIDASGSPVHDGGLLTGTVIASLSLEHVDTVVLSACETSVGVSGGGSLGLQRAFHQAGVRNVIGAGWKIDDQASATVMRLFYYYLLQEKLPPIESLRQAQLDVRHSHDLDELAKLRGPNFRQATKRLQTNHSDPYPVKVWAGFSLSGIGR
jgi:CHAT domain-containing protein